MTKINKLSQTETEYAADAEARFQDETIRIKSEDQALMQAPGNRLKTRIYNRAKRAIALGLTTLAFGGLLGHELGKPSGVPSKSPTTPTEQETPAVMVEGGPLGLVGEVHFVSSDDQTPAQRRNAQVKQNHGKLPDTP